jgi:hypothetical protein
MMRKIWKLLLRQTPLLSWPVAEDTRGSEGQSLSLGIHSYLAISVLSYSSNIYSPVTASWQGHVGRRCRLRPVLCTVLYCTALYWCTVPVMMDGGVEDDIYIALSRKFKTDTYIFTLIIKISIQHCTHIPISDTNISLDLILKGSPQLLHIKAD